MKTLDKAQVHRFREFVAVSIGKGETLYLTHEQATRLGSALVNCAADVHVRQFQASTFSTWEL